MFSNFSAASDEQVYAGEGWFKPSSKNFDERTGKYKNDSPTQKPEGKEKRALMREGRKQRAEEKKRGEKTNLPSSGRRKVSPAKKKTPASNSPALKARMEKAKKAKTGSEEKKMTMKEHMAQLREGRKQRAEEKKRGEKQTGPGSGRREVSPAKKETPASNSPALKARMEKARLERVKKAKMKKPTVRKKK
jgi:hypothetical protein